MDNLQSIQTQLRRRDSRFLLNTWSELALGIALSFLAPLLIVLIVRLMCWGWRAHSCPWVWYFLAGALITLPLLYRLEIGAQGGLLKDLTERFNSASFPKDEALSFKHVGAVGAELSRTRTPVTGAMEIFLLGPRLVVSALRNLRLRALSKDVKQDRLAGAVSALYRIEGGAATDKMLEEGQTPQELSKVLAYLLFFDWIGIANDGSKVWLLTESRRELERAPQ